MYHNLQFSFFFDRQIRNFLSEIIRIFNDIVLVPVKWSQYTA